MSDQIFDTPSPNKGEEIWPEKQWQWSRDRTMAALENDDLVIEKKTGKWIVSYKQYLKDERGKERTRKPYSIIEGIYTQQGTKDIKDMFGDGKAFSFPKPKNLVEHLLQFSTASESLVLDSFAGSGTTGHATLALNKADGGKRRFILVEMDREIATSVTGERLKRAILGYQRANGSQGTSVAGLGGGFRYCNLGETLFDEKGNIRPSVTFAELAGHIYFTETGAPIPTPANGESPFLGVHKGVGVYLLFNGVLGDKRPNSGNILTSEVLRQLPQHDGRKIVYGEGTRLSVSHLKREGISFRQVPYQVAVS